MQKAFIVSALALTAMIGASTRILAEGALAIGSTGNASADGVAIGGSVNAPTREEAVRTAMETCRSQPDVRKAAARCRIVRTFSRKCYAAAFDPKTGTPGAGWGLGPDVATATEQALAHCRKSAGKDRAPFCVIQDNITACDKHD
jgi:Domain of unknown function (DUF4189)